MTDQWTSVPSERVVELAQALVDLPWPVAVEDITPLLEELGWVEIAPDLYTYTTGLEITPDLATAAKAQGELTSIDVNLVDYDKEPSEEREEFVKDVGGSNVLALSDVFGESEIPPFPRQSDIAFWNLPNGARLSHIVTPKMVTLWVDSPRMAAAKRTIAKNPEL
ncbi:MAG: DUF6301 family protein [bacterium]|nr:DUF6301 family protein [bacterium]